MAAIFGIFRTVAMATANATLTILCFYNKTLIRYYLPAKFQALIPKFSKIRFKGGGQDMPKIINFFKLFKAFSSMLKICTKLNSADFE